MSSDQRPFPILRVVAGIIFVLAGLLVYYGVNLGISFALLFVAAGIAVVAIGVLGHRARPGDIGLFIVGLLVLAIVVSSYSFSSEGTYAYSVNRGQVLASSISVVANTNFGSITVRFSNNVSLAYQIIFGRSVAFPFSSENQSRSLSNVTRGGVLILTASTSTASITIILGTGYLVDVNASAGTGSISLSSASHSQKFGLVSLSTGTGSINAAIDTMSISYLSLQGGTGSVNLQSNYLSPIEARVPISISTGTGSVNFDVAVPNNVAVSIDASNGFGTISKNLQGFTISQSTNGKLQASLGDVAIAARSFVVDISVGTGSMNLNVVTVAP